MATYKDIKSKFFSLHQKEQEKLFKEIYSFSKDVKTFLNSRLLGVDEDVFIKEIEKATIIATPSGIPRDIKASEVNKIITRAKKSAVSLQTLAKLEWIAFDGYMDFLNSYGGGPDIYEDKVYDHLKNYIELIKLYMDKESISNEMNFIESYLSKHDNMYNDHLWDLLNEEKDDR